MRQVGRGALDDSVALGPFKIRIAESQDLAQHLARVAAEVGAGPARAARRRDSLGTMAGRRSGRPLTSTDSEHLAGLVVGIGGDVSGAVDQTDRDGGGFQLGHDLGSGQGWR